MAKYVSILRVAHVAPNNRAANKQLDLIEKRTRVKKGVSSAKFVSGLMHGPTGWVSMRMEVVPVVKEKKKKPGK